MGGAHVKPPVRRAGIDGTEAAQLILEVRDLPIVFLSSHTDPAVVEKTEGITSYGYIVKNSGDTVLITSLKMAFRLFESRKLATDTFDHVREMRSLRPTRTADMFPNR